MNAIIISIPGFTAEESLTRATEFYRASPIDSQIRLARVLPQAKRGFTIAGHRSGKTAIREIVGPMAILDDVVGRLAGIAPQRDRLENEAKCRTRSLQFSRRNIARSIISHRFCFLLPAGSLCIHRCVLKDTAALPSNGI
jgi:hypothetical protein